MFLRVLVCVLILMFVAAAVPSQADAGWQRWLTKGVGWLITVIAAHEVTEEWKEITEEDNDDNDDGCYDSCSCSPTGSCHSGCDCTSGSYDDGSYEHNYYGSMYGSNYGSQYGSY